MTDPTRISVRGAQPYDVVVGRGLLGELAAMGVTGICTNDPRLFAGLAPQ